MAKSTPCAFCSKEVTTGFFKGEDKLITLSTSSFVCCPECYEKYNKYVPGIRNRFVAKIENYEKSNKFGLFKSIKDAEKKAFFMKYCEEAKEYERREANASEAMPNAFYSADMNGNVWITEASMSHIDSIDSSKNQLKDITRNLNDAVGPFNKSDISKLEFTIEKWGNNSSMFQVIYSYFVRLNDEKVITYKPCIAKGAALGGFQLGSKKRARKEIIASLERFKATLGLDLPIVERKKF